MMLLSLLLNALFKVSCGRGQNVEKKDNKKLKCGEERYVNIFNVSDKESTGESHL